MSDDNSVGFVAVYDSVEAAVADLEALDGLRQDQLVGKYDAAVIDQENGKPHIVKRVDHPRINVLPEVIGKGALPSGQLKDAAKGLAPGEAALVFVGEPTVEKAFENAVKSANTLAKQDFDSAADDLADALLKAAQPS
ncbi:MAG: hypothetical protein JO073_04165 [Actinobacteria bacterium]|nr:hypothetical protein [Actinomycetota bacterium]